jgi:hypothetical protein
MMNNTSKREGQPKDTPVRGISPAAKKPRTARGKKTQTRKATGPGIRSRRPAEPPGPNPSDTAQTHAPIEEEDDLYKYYGIRLGTPAEATVTEPETATAEIRQGGGTEVAVITEHTSGAGHTDAEADPPSSGAAPADGSLVMARGPGGGVPLRLFRTSDAAWAYADALEQPPQTVLWDASLASADEICVVEFKDGEPVDWESFDVPWPGSRGR